MQCNGQHLIKQLPSGLWYEFFSAAPGSATVIENQIAGPDAATRTPANQVLASAGKCTLPAADVAPPQAIEEAPSSQLETNLLMQRQEYDSGNRPDAGGGNIFAVFMLMIAVGVIAQKWLDRQAEARAVAEIDRPLTAEELGYYGPRSLMSLPSEESLSEQLEPAPFGSVRIERPLVAAGAGASAQTLMQQPVSALKLDPKPASKLSETDVETGLETTETGLETFRVSAEVSGTKPETLRAQLETLEGFGFQVPETSAETRWDIPKGSLEILETGRPLDEESARALYEQLMSAGHTAVKKLAWGIFGATPGSSKLWAKATQVIEAWQQQDPVRNKED